MSGRVRNFCGSLAECICILKVTDRQTGVARAPGFKRSLNSKTRAFLAGYGLGRMLGREFFERRGRWLGLTPAVRARIEMFFENWGILTVVLSRSLLSFKSSAVNLLAGASRYRLRLFLPFAIVGRLIWRISVSVTDSALPLKPPPILPAPRRAPRLVTGSHRSRIHDPAKSCEPHYY